MSNPAHPQRASVPPSGAAADGLLAEWSHRYRTALASYFRKRLKSPNEAEDLVQEVFMRLARQQGLASVRLIEPYLFQTAAHVLTDHARNGAARRSQSHTPYEDEDHPSELSAPETVLAGWQSVDRLLEALARLPQKTRAIFVLRRWEEKSNADIAGMLGISVSAVEKHMSKALLHLKESMEREG